MITLKWWPAMEVDWDYWAGKRTVDTLFMPRNKPFPEAVRRVQWFNQEQIDDICPHLKRR